MIKKAIIGLALLLLVSGCREQPELRFGMSVEEVKAFYPSEAELVRAGIEYLDGPTEEELSLDGVYVLNMLDEYGMAFLFNSRKELVEIHTMESATMDDLR